MSETAMREEWSVRHAQGTHPGPFNERDARKLAAEMIARDDRRRPEARGKVRLVRRYVTDWEEVPLAPVVPAQPSAGEGS